MAYFIFKKCLSVPVLNILSATKVKAIHHVLMLWMETWCSFQMVTDLESTRLHIPVNLLGFNLHSPVNQNGFMSNLISATWYILLWHLSLWFRNSSCFLTIVREGTVGKGNCPCVQHLHQWLSSVLVLKFKSCLAAHQQENFHKFYIQIWFSTKNYSRILLHTWFVCITHLYKSKIVSV